MSEPVDLPQFVEPGASEPARRRRIVVVDDDRRMVGLLCEILGLHGHEVRGAQSFEEATKLLEQLPADLLVTDLKMPGVDGASAFRELRERKLVSRALVVSGFVDADARDVLASVPGVVGIVAKPFDVDDLARRVAEGLAQPEAHGHAAP